MTPMKKRLLSLFFAGLVLLGFLTALNNLETARQAEGQRQLEEAVRRAAITCYALEGAYPPDIGYLQAHYGLRYDESSYTIHYQLPASNLMPDITILEMP